MENGLKQLNFVRLVNDRLLCKKCGAKYTLIKVDLAYYSFEPFVPANIRGYITTNVGYCTNCKEYVVNNTRHKEILDSLNGKSINVIEFEDKTDTSRFHIKKQITSEKEETTEVIKLGKSELLDDYKIAISVIRYLLNIKYLYTHLWIDKQSILNFVIDDLSQKITPRQLKNAIFLKLEEFLNITPKDRNKFVFIYREKDKNKIHQKLLNKKTELEMGLHNKEKQLYERQISASSYQPTQCWNCQTGLSTNDEYCIDCGGYVCPSCGECLCNWWKRRNHRRDHNKSEN